jgi:AcrR family transcriptional regulator
MRQEERRARTRSALLRAASAAFATRGYDGGSLDSIAAAAQLSKGAVYAHFPTKLDLYLAVAEGLLDQSEFRVQRVSAAVGRGANPAQAAAAYFGLAGDDEHCALMAEVWQVAASEEAVRDRLDAFRQRRHAALGRAGVDRGLPPGQALEQADMVARLIDAEILYRRISGAARTAALG